MAKPVAAFSLEDHGSDAARAISFLTAARAFSGALPWRCRRVPGERAAASGWSGRIGHPRPSRRLLKRSRLNDLSAHEGDVGASLADVAEAGRDLAIVQDLPGQILVVRLPVDR